MANSSKGSHPTALSRGNNHLDVFICGNDGQVYTSWYPKDNANNVWSGVNSAGWFPIGGWFPAGAPVAAVARSVSQLDVFICGHDGRVWTSWWPGSEGRGWSSVINNGWLPIGGFFPPGAPVTAVSRSAGQLDLFITGLDGRVYTSWWPGPDNGKWSGISNNWMSLGGFFPPGTPIAAVARSPRQLDLFICGYDGRVYTSWWPGPDNGKWSGIANNWMSLGGFFPPSAPIAAIARSPTQFDLFICGLDGQVWTSWWKEGGSWSGINNSWKSLKGTFTPGAQVSAVSRQPDRLDLFICGLDSKVYTTWWTKNDGWSSGTGNWSAIGGIFPPATCVAVVARSANQLDLFIRGFDNQIYTSWWPHFGGWSGVNNTWMPIGWPQGATVAAATTSINAKYAALGGQGGFLGQALTQVVDDAGQGCFHVDYKNGAIYWSAADGAHVIFGEIYKKWVLRGRIKSGTGFPITDETASGDGGFRYNLFKKGAAICWTSSTGPRLIQGDIYRRWIAIGGVNSVARVPITDEAECVGGFFNDLKESSIYWTPGHGAFVIYGGIRRKWLALGGASGLGCPISDEVAGTGGGRKNDFERGTINWNGSFANMTVVPNAARSRQLMGSIVSQDPAALGGTVQVTVYDNGLIRWSGNGHDSGLDGYHYGVSAVLRPSPGSSRPLLSLVHQGSVGGALTAGSRDDPWEGYSYNPAVKSGFADYLAGSLSVTTAYSSDIGDFFASFLSSALNWTVGSLIGPVGLVIFIGVEVGSLIATGSLVPGARVLNGILWLAGPENTLLAVLAGGIASLGSRSRALTSAEYQFAKDTVFFNSLPPIDKIVLTDILGAGDRPFTFPTSGGKVTVNMGPDAFNDPLSFKVATGARRRGETFIHELVHAWQIEHTSMRLSLLADALASQLKGQSSYDYGNADRPFKDFNLEQQAQIVADWALGVARPGTQQTSKPKDVDSPYFKYIIGNIQVGQY